MHVHHHATHTHTISRGVHVCWDDNGSTHPNQVHSSPLLWTFSLLQSHCDGHLILLGGGLIEGGAPIVTNGYLFCLPPLVPPKMQWFFIFELASTKTWCQRLQPCVPSWSSGYGEENMSFLAISWILLPRNIMWVYPSDQSIVGHCSRLQWLAGNKYVSNETRRWYAKLVHWFNDCHPFLVAEEAIHSHHHHDDMTSIISSVPTHASSALYSNKKQESPRCVLAIMTGTGNPAREQEHIVVVESSKKPPTSTLPAMNKCWIVFF